MERFTLPPPADPTRFLLSREELAVVQKVSFERLPAIWREIEEAYGLDGVRALGRQDRFYLLSNILGRFDVLHPWLYERCREVEADPDDYLDLWAREHYKSTIITFGGSIQEILNDAEITIGIFSHVKPVARKFLIQIKTELEVNEYLKGLYPDILYANPTRESPRWSEEKGIVVRRSTNSKEATVEGHGLVDGQPTSAHFKLRVYDDVVTIESVSTPEQVQKTTDAWSLSDNLGAKGEDPVTGRSTPARKWHIGTRYSFGDTYNEMMKRKALKPRVHAATDDGSVNGKPVFFTPQQWAEKRQTQSAPILACQLLQNPSAGNQAMFAKDMLRFTDIRPKTLNVYILGDPARSKKKNSDKTAIPVIGVDSARNYYLLDGYHHKMNLAERWQCLKNLYVKWTAEPGVQVVRVGWEDYGRINDIEYFEERMERDKISFEIEELAWPNDGPGSKFDRIQRLVPAFQQHKFYLAAVVEQETKAQRTCRQAGEVYRILVPAKRMDENGKLYALNKNFLEQFLDYPFVGHDDLIDAVSRIYDINARPPQIIEDKDLLPEIHQDGV
jgi:phage terminase large subunit-like protein